jgi:hypothetical protein
MKKLIIQNKIFKLVLSISYFSFLLLNSTSCSKETNTFNPDNTDNGVFETELSIQYGDYEEEYFLLWRKETSTSRPIVIWSHWGGGTPEGFAEEAEMLNSMNVHALSWGTLHKDDPRYYYTNWDNMESVSYSVLDWVIANADEYKIDTNQIIISGQSRGSGFSWHLCFRGNPGIKGIYMANGLGNKVSQSVNLTGLITENAPPIYFTWKPGAGLDGDSHTQDGAIQVTNAYNTNGIFDRVLGWELDNNELYQYLPEFITNVLNW